MSGRVIDEVAQPLGGYSHVRVHGGFAFVCGLSARQPDDTIPGVEFVGPRRTLRMDIGEQTRATIANIERVLADVDLGLGDIVSITTYLTDMNDFVDYNTVYAEYFAADGPVRTTVAVAQLPHPHLLIEMTAIAAVDGGAAS